MTARIRNSKAFLTLSVPCYIYKTIILDRKQKKRCSQTRQREEEKKTFDSEQIQKRISNKTNIRPWPMSVPLEYSSSFVFVCQHLSPFGVYSNVAIVSVSCFGTLVHSADTKLFSQLISEPFSANILAYNNLWNVNQPTIPSTRLSSNCCVVFCKISVDASLMVWLILLLLVKTKVGLLWLTPS